MLQQSPLGRYTSFIYENAVLLGHLDYMFKVAKTDPDKADAYLKSLRDGTKKDRAQFEEIHLCGAARANASINQVVLSFIDHYKNGIKGVTPSARLADSMALTDANYQADDFMLPYPEVVIDVPEECAGYLSSSYEDTPKNRRLLEDFGIDPNSVRDGFKIACIFLSITKHPEQAFEEFDGKTADRSVDIAIITEGLISGPLVKESVVPNIFRYKRNFNPAPICTFSRPLIKGMEMEQVLRLHTGRIKDTPGAYPLKDGTEDNGTGVVTDWHFAADSELEYIIRLSRMALNCVHAITQIGYDEVKQAVPQKLIRRGSNAAKRAIPDILRPVTIISDEANKSQYSDASIGHSGIVMSPHFRRGHWRRQHHGKDNKEVKTIWIAPQVINKHLLRDKADQNVVKNATTEKR